MKTVAEFEFDGRHFVIRRPTRKQRSEIDLLFSETLFKYIRRGVSTQADAMKIIEEKGIWTPEHEARKQQLIEEIVNLEIKANDEKLPASERRDACMDLARLRRKLLKTNAVIQSIVANTADQKAREEVLLYDTWILLFESDKRVFDKFETFEQFQEYVDTINSEDDEDLTEQQLKNRALIPEVIFHLIGWMHGLTVDEVRNPTEIRVLQALAEPTEPSDESTETEQPTDTPLESPRVPSEASEPPQTDLGAKSKKKAVTSDSGASDG